MPLNPKATSHGQAGCLAFLLLSGCAQPMQSPPARSEPQTTQFPTLIKGKNIGAIEAAFEIRSYSEKTSNLQGRLHLRNTANTRQEFGVFHSFFRHIQLTDVTNNQRVSFTKRIGMLEPFVDLVDVEAEHSKVIPFEVTLAEFFDAPPAICRLSFSYDQRLIRRKFQPQENPYMDWSVDSVVLKIPQENRNPLQ
jgi:hypothetical protein